MPNVLLCRVDLYVTKNNVNYDFVTIVCYCYKNEFMDIRFPQTMSNKEQQQNHTDTYCFSVSLGNCAS